MGQEKEEEEEKNTTPPPPFPLPFLREACLALRLLRARPPSAGPLVTHGDEILNGEGKREAGMRRAAELAARALEATLLFDSAKKEKDKDSSSSSSPPPPSFPFETIMQAVSAALCAAVVNSLELRFCDEDESIEESVCAKRSKVEEEESEDSSDPLPLAVFAFAARANHSCRPSASLSTRSKGKISLRALRDLRKGDEVTICYLDGGSGALFPLAERRHLLAETRCFRCECERCSLEEKQEEEEEGPADAEMSEGGAATEAETSAARRAVLFSSSLRACLSGEKLLARGETAVIESCGESWAACASALVEAAGEALGRGGGGSGGGTTETAATTTTNPPLFPFAGPPPHPRLFESVRAAAARALPSDRSKNHTQLLRLLAEIPEAAADAAEATEEEREGQRELEALLLREALRRKNENNNDSTAVAATAEAAFSIARAAAQASARAAALLGNALGRAHPRAERARFLAFGGRGGGSERTNEGSDEYNGGASRAALPFTVAAQVVRLAAALEKASEREGGRV